MSPVGSQSGGKIRVQGVNTDLESVTCDPKNQYNPQRVIARSQEKRDLTRRRRKNTDEGLLRIGKPTGLVRDLHAGQADRPLETARRNILRTFRMRRGDQVINTERDVEREIEDGVTVRGDEVQFNLHDLREKTIYVFTLRGQKFGVEKLPSGEIRYHRLVEQTDND